MDKTSEKVIKDPRRVEAARKGREKYMNKLKQNILNDAKKGSGDTTNTSNETAAPATSTSNETTSSANDATIIKSNDTYVYGVGMLAVLAIGVCVFFAYQAKNKKQASDHPAAQHEKKHGQPPKRRPML